LYFYLQDSPVGVDEEEVTEEETEEEVTGVMVVVVAEAAVVDAVVEVEMEMQGLVTGTVHRKYIACISDCRYVIC
jgi:hypothetical protein